MINEHPNTEPEWISPKNAALKFDVSRATLYDWIARGLIRSASFKERHQRHGKRLIEVASLRKYILSRVEEPPDPIGTT